MNVRKDNIVLTGFGLFRDYKENPSWEAVKLVDASKFGENVNVIKIQVPVSYDDVERAVKEIWNIHEPILVIHCGVSCIAHGINLEKRAVVNIDRYCQPDVKNCKPICSTTNGSTSCQSQLDYVCTKLDVEQLQDDINEYYKADRIKLPAYISERAGEYLCEYMYRCSLKTNSDRTLFVHVPNTDEDLTALDIAKCLEIVIESALYQIKSCQCK